MLDKNSIYDEEQKTSNDEKKESQNYNREKIIKITQF